MKRDQNYFRGCILGGAIGDALGLPVEFLSVQDIKFRYGNAGIIDLEPASGGIALISDDTQMTMFTAEGHLRAIARGTERGGVCHIPSVVHSAYQRWFMTQGGSSDAPQTDGWLLNLPELHSRRGPGNTCLTALSRGKQGTMEEPINNSKGCGGIMRAAPIGLLWDRRHAFTLACESAALTHGHPSGYLSAGALAHIIACIIEGMTLEKAVEDALGELAKRDGHGECSHLLNRAVELAGTPGDAHECINQLGEGWVGEEALAIAVYCALQYRDDFRKAIIAAVNHGGDSDSTGAITGNILGAWLGIGNIPREWLEIIELRDALIQLADDILTRYEDTDDWREKYPGW